MMAPLWLEDVAHEAIAAAFILRITQVEAPEDGNLAWISRHCLKEAPNQHNEQHVEENEQGVNC